jgi:hypothetical protein
MVAALEAYLADRAQRAGVGEWRQLTGPLLATADRRGDRPDGSARRPDPARNRMAGPPDRPAMTSTRTRP